MRTKKRGFQEATVGGGLSFSDIEDAISNALSDERKAAATGGDDAPYCYPREVFPGFFIYSASAGASRQYYKRAYSVLDGKVTLGSGRTPVEQQWVEVQREALESFRCHGGAGPHEARLSEVHLTDLGAAALEEAEGGACTLKGVTLIRPGVSKNRRRYTEAVLRRDGPTVFEGTPAFLTNHRVEDKSVRNLVGVYRNVQFAEGRLVADLVASPQKAPELKHALWAARELGGEKVGVSIDTAGSVKVAKTEGAGMVHEVTALARTPQTSVDLVINPAAGGRLTEADAPDAQHLEDLRMLELIARLKKAALEGMNQTAAQAICGEASDEEIRTANAELAEALIARRDGTETATRNTETVKVETPPAKPAAGDQAAGQATSGTTSLTEAEVERRVEDRFSALEKRLEERAQKAECAGVLAEKLAEARDLGELERELLNAKFGSRLFETKDLDAEIVRLRDLKGRSNPNRVNVPGMGGAAGGSVSVVEAFDVNKARLEAAVVQRMRRANGDPWSETVEIGGKNVRPFTGISEAVMAFHPETVTQWAHSPQYAAQEALQYFQWNGGPVHRLAEDVSTTTFNQAWADVLNRTLQRVVRDPDLNHWRNWVSDIVNFRDLTNTYKFVRVGELGTMPTVNENGTYQETTANTDDQQALSIVKKGFLYTLSWEAILRDDINVLSRIPQNLGRAWAWTVHDVIYGILQLNTGTGQTMDVDSTVLYHANHANVASSTFSAANLETVRKKMPVQTDPDSGKRKNYIPKFLLYATPDLDQGVTEALESQFKIPAAVTNAGEVNLINWINRLQLTPIGVVYPTATTTRWEVIANPADADTVAVGFLGGRQDPDVLIQDMETVGSRFTADKITYKVRGTVGGAAIQFRSFSRGNL